MTTSTLINRQVLPSPSFSYHHHSQTHKPFTMTAAVDIPSHMRPVPGSVNIAAAKFPQSVKPTQSTQPSEIAANFVSSFNSALQRKNLLDVSLLFLECGFWRDHLALTWQLRTLQGPARIYDFLKGAATSKDGFRIKKIEIDASNVVRAPKIAPVDADGEVMGVQFFLTIDTAIGTGLGLVRLVEEAGNWKIFTLYTRLEELKGHEEAIYNRRPRGVEHGGKPGRFVYLLPLLLSHSFTPDGNQFKQRD